MNFSALNENRLYLKVADKILQLIQQQSLKKGDRVPSERVLSSEFNVSRPTVREALVALEIAGVIEVRTASGIFLKRPEASFASLSIDKGPGPFEILEARKVLESEACGLAAKRIKPEQLERLAQLLQAMEEENLQENPTEQADQAFHCLIADAAGNSAIATVINWLWTLRNNSEISTYFHNRVRLEGIKPIIEDHRAILNALQEGNSSLARKEMYSHLQRVIDGLIAIEEKKG